MTTSELEADEISQIVSHTIDVDTHEMAPVHMWGPLFGEASARLGERISETLGAVPEGGNRLVRPGLVDDAPISTESVWTTKGPDAPGAFDFDRRLDVLDVMGTTSQLIFPTAALISFTLLTSGAGHMRPFFGLDSSPETDAMLRAAMDGYNEWAIRTVLQFGGRLRPVGLVVGRNLESLMGETAALIDRGAKAIWIATSLPPGGLSPASPELDQFWSMIEDANIAVTLHLGTEGDFRASEEWSKAPAFKPGKINSLEILFEPFTTTTLHLAAENFLTAMVLGGVFERHPRLRFGVIEMGASWLGPLSEHLDMWVESSFKKRMSAILSEPPSSYLARNVRVTPFWFEPIDMYFERYSAVRTCYCFSSDYPHIEGGKDTKARSLEKLLRLNDLEAVRQYFVDNGRWLLPE
jgi:predicted TIM-barrel fold metal-dependent hydrolase